MFLELLFPVFSSLYPKYKGSSTIQWTQVVPKAINPGVNTIIMDYTRGAFSFGKTFKKSDGQRYNYVQKDAD